MTGKRVRPRTRRRVTPVVAAVLAVGVGSAWALARIDTGRDGERGSLTAGEVSTGSTPDGDEVPTGSTRDGAPSPATPGRRAVADPEAPTGLTLPSGNKVRVQAVSTGDDGVLDVPDDISVAGWWRGGSRIGDPFGATLIAAHVDSRVQGLGPYAELLVVQPGARIVVRSASQRQVFRVTSLRVVPRDRLSRATELFSVSGPRRLVLVTCAGPFDASAGGYQNLAVVTARPKGLPVTAAA